MSSSTTKKTTSTTDSIAKTFLKILRYTIKFIGRWGSKFAHDFNWGYQTSFKWHQSIHNFHTTKTGAPPSIGWKVVYGLITLITTVILYFVLLVTSFFKAI